MDTAFFDLYHPGAKLPEKFHSQPKDLSNIVVNIGRLLTRAANAQRETLEVYLFDKTVTLEDPALAPEFLTGADILVEDGSTRVNLVYNDTSYQSLRDNASKLFYEQEMEIGGRVWVTIVMPIPGTYTTNLTSVIFTGVMLFVASLILAIWMIHNMHKSIAMHRVVTKAAAEASIVSNLFPPAVRERMIQDAENKAKRVKEQQEAAKAGAKDAFINNGGKRKSFNSRLNEMLTSEGIFGSKPIAELFPYTTLMFADLVGKCFTFISVHGSAP